MRHKTLNVVPRGGHREQPAKGHVQIAALLEGEPTSQPGSISGIGLRIDGRVVVGLRPGVPTSMPPPARPVEATGHSVAVDWLTRIRPAVWLEAAGLHTLGAELRHWRAADPVVAIQVVTMLADHGVALRAARDAAWRSVRQRLFAREADSPELWAEVVDATRRAAAGAAAHRLADAAAAGRFNAGAEVNRFLADVEPVLLWQRVVFARVELPWPWPVLVDTVTHAAHIVAWAGVDRLDRHQPGLLEPSDPPQAWGHAFDAANAATSGVVTQLDQLAAATGATWATAFFPDPINDPVDGPRIDEAQRTSGAHP